MTLLSVRLPVNSLLVIRFLGSQVVCGFSTAESWCPITPVLFMGQLYDSSAHHDLRKSDLRVDKSFAFFTNSMCQLNHQTVGSKHTCEMQDCALAVGSVFPSELLLSLASISAPVLHSPQNWCVVERVQKNP